MIFLWPCGKLSEKIVDKGFPVSFWPSCYIEHLQSAWRGQSIELFFSVLLLSLSSDFPAAGPQEAVALLVLFAESNFV